MYVFMAFCKNSFLELTPYETVFMVSSRYEILWVYNRVLTKNELLRWSTLSLVMSSN